MDEFRVIHARDGFIMVRHRGEGHEYSFRVLNVEPYGLYETDIREAGRAVHGAEVFRTAALAFAITEAKRRGMLSE